MFPTQYPSHTANQNIQMTPQGQYQYSPEGGYQHPYGMGVDQQKNNIQSYSTQQPPNDVSTISQFASMSLQQPTGYQQVVPHYVPNNNQDYNYPDGAPQNRQPSYPSYPPPTAQATSQPHSNPMAAFPPAPPMPSQMSQPPNGTRMTPYSQQAPGVPSPQAANYQYSNSMQPGYQESMPRGPPRTADRLSADRLPSAIEVLEENRAQWSGIPFRTGERNVVPPLVTTNFVTQDDGGNCGPRFIRSSMYAVPTTSELLKTVGIPFTISVSPFAQQHPEDRPIMLSDMGPQGPVRCVRCRAYMNAFVCFIDGGRRFVCPLCNARTEVPAEYFAHLDHTGRRTDALHRPELCLGSYELTATAEYCRNNQLPLPPAFVFVLDVSQSALRSGLVQLFCSQFVDRILPKLPRETTGTGEEIIPRIGFITYDHQLHFYSFGRDPRTDSFLKPQMNVVADVEDVFVPTVEGFLVHPDPSAIASVLQLIPTQFHNEGPGVPDSILGPAIQAGLEALKAANRSGKLFVFHTNLPTAEAPGKLKGRDNRQLIGTDKEKTLLVPSGDFYTGLGQLCVEAGCSVDLFLFPNSFVDVATISEVPRLTAGHLYKYNCFQSDLQGHQFISDLEMAVALPRAYNAVMRVRTSAGIRAVDFLGNFHVPNTTDVELACVDPTTCVTVELKHDDKLEDNDVVFIQAACLYTTLSGQRRLRVHNLSLSTARTPADVFRLVDLDPYMTWMGKHAVRALCSRALNTVTEELTQQTATVLAAYRKHCAGGPGEAVELVLPQTMKLYPLLVQSLFKTDAFMAAERILIDDRCMNMFLLNGADVAQSNAYIYPRIYPVHDIVSGTFPPVPIRCSMDYFSEDGAYLVDNGVKMFLWLGSGIGADWVEAVFNVLGVRQLEPERVYQLPRLNTETSRYLCALIDQLHRAHNRNSRLRVVRPGDKLEHCFKLSLVEDRYMGHSVSYMEYIIHIHKEVRTLLR